MVSIDLAQLERYLDARDFVSAFKLVVSWDKSGELDKPENKIVVDRLSDLFRFLDIAYVASRSSSSELGAYLSDTSSGKPFYVSRDFVSKLLTAVRSKDPRALGEALRNIPRTPSGFTDLSQFIYAMIYRITSSEAPKLLRVWDLASQAYNAYASDDLVALVSVFATAEKEGLQKDLEDLLGISFHKLIYSIVNHVLSKDPSKLGLIKPLLDEKSRRIVEVYEKLVDVVRLVNESRFKEAYSLAKGLEGEESVLKEIGVDLRDVKRYVISGYFTYLAKQRNVSLDSMDLATLNDLIKQVSMDLGASIDEVSEAVAVDKSLADLYLKYRDLVDLLVNADKEDPEKIIDKFSEYVRRYGDAVYTELSKLFRDVSPEKLKIIVAGIENNYLVKASDVVSRAVEYAGSRPLPLSASLKVIVDAFDRRDSKAIVSEVNRYAGSPIESNLRSIVASLSMKRFSENPFDAGLVSFVAGLMGELGVKELHDYLSMYLVHIDLLRAVSERRFIDALSIYLSYDRSKIDSLKAVLSRISGKSGDEALKDFLAGVELGYLAEQLSGARDWRDVAKILSDYVSKFSVPEGVSKDIVSILRDTLPLATSLAGLESLVNGFKTSGRIDFGALSDYIDKKIPKNLASSAVAWSIYELGGVIRYEDAPKLIEFLTKYGFEERDAFRFVLALDAPEINKFIIDRVINELTRAWEEAFSSKSPEKLRALVDAYGEVLGSLSYSDKIAGKDVSVNLGEAPQLFETYIKYAPVVNDARDKINTVLSEEQDFIEAFKTSGGKPLDEVMASLKLTDINHDALKGNISTAVSDENFLKL
ncbi:MAG: hypothetical protein C0179_06625, partial [Fervidicoccus sp.]